MIQNILITIFVPVFNGEKYLNETLISIQNQTYKNIEVLLVDDSSTDGSKTILDTFANFDNRFRVFEKENGGNVSVSWNFIKPEIKGDFVFYSSQDDIFSPDLIQKMVSRYEETQAETIVPDMEYYYENNPNNKKIKGFYGNRSVVINGRQACEASIYWNIHGFALIKSNLILNEFFFEDAFDTDELISRILFFKSNKVAFCEGTFYYRQDNSQAITKNFSTKNFYALTTSFRLYGFLKVNNFDMKYVIEIKQAMLHSYIYLLGMVKHYNFISETEKGNVSDYLANFRKTHFSNSFYLSNSSDAIRLFKIKYLLLLLIFITPFLFSFLVNKNSYKIQKKQLS